ncbi:MAG TPA: phosphate propanoyltransferase, partial [Candidatus Absconditabacterales bacterium]|nr:phosphate propanoyltransferase [Candidatus Absconditabacterales bacterium]HOQ79206.1 phosphate propanoyltransferase [Candidatus Absconditabacterales bacterium]
MKITVGISNRHVHLSRKDADLLFGEGYELTKIKDLSQPGQFATEECVVLKGPKGEISKVRILGPYRKDTQIEVLLGDNYKLGINAPVRLSGDLENTPGLEIIGPNGSITTKKGAIVAQRHIHMNLEEAKEFGLENGQIVSVKTEGERGLIFENVIIRADSKGALDFHIDMEEANAAGV